MTHRKSLIAGIAAVALLLSSCSASGSGDDQATGTTAAPTTTEAVPDPVTSTTTTTEPVPEYTRDDYVDALVEWQGSAPTPEEREIGECLMDTWVDSLDLVNSGAFPEDIADARSVDEVLEVARIGSAQRESVLADLGVAFGTCGFGSFYLGQGFTEASGTGLSPTSGDCVDEAIIDMTSEDPEMVVAIIEDSDPDLVDTMIAGMIARCPVVATEVVIGFLSSEGIEVDDAGADCLTGQFQVRLAGVDEDEDIGAAFERISEEVVVACTEELRPN